jgi:hypothetical protein
MTIVAAAKSRDALVLGTDSMTQVVAGLPPRSGVLKAYANATKLFRLANHDLAVATFGAGNIGSQSVGGVVLDYADSIKDKAPSTIQAVADGLAAHVGNLYDSAFSSLPDDQRPALGFLVGGFSEKTTLAELWEVRFPSLLGATGRTQVVRKPDDFGANWRGIEIPFTRLHLGFDPRLIEALAASGVDRNLMSQAAAKFQSPVLFDAMPIQDTIDFAKHILRTTISVVTFEVGSPSCGEPLQLAVILRRTGFQWVEEPRFHV